MRNAELIKAYAEGKEIECFCVGWDAWLPLTKMSNSALRAFLGIQYDPEWSFRIKE